jgi:hypothetical protein
MFALIENPIGSKEANGLSAYLSGIKGDNFKFNTLFTETFLEPDFLEAEPAFPKRKKNMSKKPKKNPIAEPNIILIKLLICDYSLNGIYEYFSQKYNIIV